ncbi:MAG TPA: purine-nucleoside phosphorylase [Ilumatobacteraceae bacterium]|nr:purine-nucleoside phosphorylase [Ilumatobacteraceae bacterium]
MASAPEPYGLATQAAVMLSSRTGIDLFDVAVVLGSGWARAASELGDGPSVALADLPGFPPPSAAGHGAAVRSIEIAGRRVLVFLGRIHLYEGHDPSVVAHGVRTAALAGCRTVVLTNGAGSLHRDWPIGQPVLISDHVNLTGRSPLTGASPPAPFASRFVDLTDLYSARLRAVARTVEPDLPDGVYVGFHGPHFETPAEIRMAGTIGGDLVGMSTVLEAIAARHMGMEVLGLSLATNLAAGISAVPIDGADVIAAGDAAGERIGRLLAAILATSGIT